MDVHGTNDGMEIQDVDADAIKEFRDPDLTYSQDLNRRYAKAASYFFDAPTNEDFNFMWMNRIKTKLTDSQESYHCKVIIYNTLNVSGFNCD